MILDQITLHNFGVYADVQEIDLTPPSRNKPIVLFGGLNGTGKTTLMDALQLCLFGTAARCVTCNGSSYKDFLTSRIRKRSPRKHASVSVVFHCTADGVETSYHVTRTWKSTGSGIREKLEVTRDECSDKSLAENWDQYISEIIPVNISHLFFFDGERIASYAASHGISELIANGVRNLFGIDVVERLQKDLQILERRQDTTISSVDIDDIHQKEKELHTLHRQIDQMERRRVILQTQGLATARHNLACVMLEYKKLGGELRDRREEIQRRVSKAEANLDACNAQMIELASSELPLLLIRDLLHEVARHAAYEQKVIQARAMVKSLQQRDAKMLRLAKTFPGTSDLLKALQEFCQADTENQEKLAACKTPLNVSDTTTARLTTFLQNRLPILEKNLRGIFAKQSDSKDEMKAAQLKQAGIPAEDSIDEVVKNRDLLVTKITQLEAKVANIDSELEKVHRKSNRLESEINALWTAHTELELLHTDASRFIRHSQLARQTLADFSLAVLRQQIGRVEHLALKSYQSLLRKDRLISTLQIHPETFVVFLRDMELTPISPEQLSAGERQLLAIALMWGMAKASGKALPVAIDMPMGRLDSSHRERLIKRYFPYASHQTLLFTTDEEIAGDYLSQLRPWVGKSYHLDYDDTKGATTVSTGFLERL